MKKVLSLILVTVLLSLCVLPTSAEYISITDEETTITMEKVVGGVLDKDTTSKDYTISKEFGTKLNEDKNSEDVTVYYPTLISQNYVVTIPGDITLKEDQAVEATITATEVVIDKNKTITVTVTSENYDEGWKIIDTVNDKNLTYSITNNGEEVIDGGIAVSFTHIGQKAYEENISFELKDKAPYIGTYTDTLTFTVTVG